MLELTKHIKPIWEQLGTEKAILTTGFLAGFFWFIPFKRSFLTNPLMTLFGASLSGSIYTFLANVVSGYLPEFIRPILPVSLISSILYFKIRDLTEKPTKRSFNLGDHVTRSSSRKKVVDLKLGANTLVVYSDEDPDENTESKPPNQTPITTSEDAESTPPNQTPITTSEDAESTPPNQTPITTSEDAEDDLSQGVGVGLSEQSDDAPVDKDVTQADVTQAKEEDDVLEM